jgi:hypothetical protein
MEDTPTPLHQPSGCMDGEQTGWRIRKTLLPPPPLQLLRDCSSIAHLGHFQAPRSIKRIAIATDNDD